MADVAAVQPTPERPDAGPAGNWEVLVVDDAPSALAVLTGLLEGQGYRVRTASGGRQALAEARADPPDLILLDIKMPGLTGYEVCGQLKLWRETRDVPIIFISALDDAEAKVKAFAVGGVDYFTKPFQFQEIVARVRTHLAMRDLQERLQQANRRLARQLEGLGKYSAELQARNAELDALAHSVAHDLENPLSVVIGFAQVLQNSLAELSVEDLAVSLNEIESAGRKMKAIVEELMLLAGLRKQEIALAPLAMGRIVGQAKERLADLIAAYGASLEIPGEWPAALGHAPWVEEVWINYVSNAIKYGGRPPRVVLGASLINEQVYCWVRDDGAGLTAGQQTRLFVPFERLGEARVEGHGLGLSIVRRMVEKLGGSVGVESEPGRGSLFYFTLPAVLGPDQPEADSADDAVA